MCGLPNRLRPAGHLAQRNDPASSTKPFRDPTGCVSWVPVAVGGSATRPSSQGRQTVSCVGTPLSEAVRTVAFPMMATLSTAVTVATVHSEVPWTGTVPST